jgi:hypothetical protein
VCSSHDYGGSANGYAPTSIAANAIALGKPLLIDEYGVWAKPGYGTWADSDKTDNSSTGRPAVSIEAQARLVSSYLESAFAIDCVAAALIWSAMDTSSAWYTGEGRFEPVDQSRTREVIRTVDTVGIPFTDTTVAGLNGWMDAAFCVMFPDGTQIGGPNSSTTTPYVIQDRSAGASRQSTQANAPVGRHNLMPGTKASLYFGGNHWYPNFSWNIGGQSHSVYAVLCPTALPTSGYSYLIAPTGDYGGLFLALDSTGHVVVGKYSSSASLQVFATSVTALGVNQTHLVSVRFTTGASGPFAIYIDGQFDSSGTVGNATTLTSNTAVQVGANPTGTISGFTGYLLELMHYGAYNSDNDRAAVTSYLLRKYGLFPATATTIVAAAASTAAASNTTAIATNTTAIAGKAATANVVTFTASGSYTPTAGAKTVQITCVGPGAGGGAGARGPSGSALVGGGGGGGGGVSVITMPVSALSAPVTVTIGTGGAGAAATSTDATGGATGSNGSAATTFGNYLSAGRGFGGVGGGVGGTGGTGGGAGAGHFSGAAGGAASGTGAAPSAPGSSSGGASGGAGGGVSTGAASSAGGTGGTSNSLALSGGSGGGTSSGGNNGTATTNGISARAVAVAAGPRPALAAARAALAATTALVVPVAGRR